MLEKTSKVLNTAEKWEAREAPQCASMAGEDTPETRWKAGEATTDRITKGAETTLAEAVKVLEETSKAAKAAKTEETPMVKHTIEVLEAAKLEDTLVKAPAEEPIMPKALVEVPADSKILNTAELEQSGPKARVLVLTLEKPNLEPKEPVREPIVPEVMEEPTRPEALVELSHVVGMTDLEALVEDPALSCNIYPEVFGETDNKLAENSRLAVARERTPSTTRKKAELSTP